MNNPKLLLAVLPVLLASTTFAQTNGGTGKGLDKLDEQEVFYALGNANLTTLQNRDLDVFKVPAAERDQLATLPLLHELATNMRLTVAKRRDLAVKVANGLNSQLPRASDAKTLLEQANMLFKFGVTPDQTELELFSENPVTQAQLKPVVDTDRLMFEKVMDLAKSERNKIANGIKNQAGFAAAAPKINALKSIGFEAEYTDNMAAYPQCLSIPRTNPKGIADRKKIADDAIAYLGQFDNPQSGVQPIVHLQIGKLQLAEGDYDKAKATLDDIVNNPGNAIVPPPALAEQNNARYFGIVAEILARKLPAAAADIPLLTTWETQNYLPQLNPADQNSVKAALAMLKFRLYSAQSDLSNDDAEKKAENDKAIDVLSVLIGEQPYLKDLVFDQLVGRIPGNADLTSMNPLILQGLRQVGFDELHKPEDEKIDPKKLQRAIDAATELVRRRAATGVDAEADRSAYFLGYAYERLDKQKEAANAFLDYAQKFGANKAWATDALDHATEWVGVLRKKDPQDPDTRALYDRFLPVAIGAPYNRKQFAFQYAALLRDEHKYKESAEYFEMVPPADKQYPDAQYQVLLDLSLELGDPATPPEARKDIVTQILGLAGNIDNLFTNATSEADRKIYVERVVIADEYAAELSRSELKDPAKSEQMLEGFEARIASAKDPAAAHIIALRIRISDYMDQGKIDDAIKALVNLLNADQAAGQGLMFEVLSAVSRDMDAAKVANNLPEQRKLAAYKAQISDFVVDWAKKNKDPKVVAKLPGIELAAAEAKKDAGELIQNPAEKQKALTDALHDYQALLNTPDEQVKLAAQLGVGLDQYDLQNYDEAVKFLSPLVTGKKVGDAFIMDGPPGAQHEVENTQFWEANFKLVKSMTELAKKNPNAPKSKEDLKTARSYVGVLYITYGKKAGGTTYRNDFDQLRAELDQLVK
jgi:predicted negative regulator of RcsB-dependent stress response